VKQLVVSYDVVGNSRRARLAKFLRGYLERVQKSVFEGAYSDSALESLRIGVSQRIDHEEDTVRIYRLCPRCQASTEVVGTGKIIDDDEGEDIVV
jgi:CRISPR-associated protein Cas2